MDIKRGAGGKFLPGTHANPNGRPRIGNSISDLIHVEFGEEIEVMIGGNLTKMERKKLMANYLAQLISTGEIRIPDRIENGERVAGRTLKYGGSEYLKHLIRVLRYVEPPVTQIDVQGGVEGIVFDKDIGGSDEVESGE